MTYHQDTAIIYKNITSYCGYIEVLKANHTNQCSPIQALLNNYAKLHFTQKQ